MTFRKTVLIAGLFSAILIPGFARGAKDSNNSSEVKKLENQEYARILNVMAKIRRGERVNIAAFGGSITTGYNSEPRNVNSWASKVGQWWKDKGSEFGADVRFMNEGCSGTDSAWGAARADVHLLNNKVDLVHLEFAMNDQWLEKQVRQRSYEGVIRQLLDGSQTAIMALFVNERNSPQPSQQYEQQPICEYYNIPFVSWKDCENIEKKNNVDWSDFFDDSETIHPNNEGHAEIAKFIIAKLEQIWACLPESDEKLPAVETELPAPLTDTGYQYVEFLTSADIQPQTNTGWNTGSPVHSEWVLHGGARSGWSTMTEEAEMTFKVHGSSVNLLYSESDSFRNAQAWVEYPDGTKSRKVTLACMNPIRNGYLGWASRELCNHETEQDFIVHVICSKGRATEQKKETNVCGILVTHLKPGN